MVILGVDAHKRTHTVVAADENGHQLGQRTVAATSAGHLEALRWAATQWPQRRWAIEDCRHLSRRLGRELLVAGEAVVNVPPKLMAGARRSARTRGKSDPIDALAVARAALREPDLPAAQLDGPAREVRLLVDHREDLVAERTRIQNRLRWHLHELEPEKEPAPRSLDRRTTLDALEQQLAGHTGTVARITRSLVERCRSLTIEIDALERELGGLMVQLAPSLLALQGCGSLTAAKLVGEVGDIRRFRSRAAFAMHSGTAPVPVWSGNTEHFRLNRGGNRQINVALHRIAITQLRLPGPGRDFVTAKLDARKTKQDAIRSLRRHLANVVYQRLMVDQPFLAAAISPLAAAA